MMIVVIKHIIPKEKEEQYQPSNTIDIGLVVKKKMAKYLIINADDFGLNKEQNEAIKDLLNNKLIT